MILIFSWIKIADLIDVIKGTVSSDVLGWKSFVAMPCQNHNDIESIFYFRLLATDAAA
jgi:homoserine dehydrogenase